MNNVRFFTILLCALLSISALSGQEVTISQEVLLKDESAYSLLGKIDDRILLLKNKPYSQELSIYDEGLTFVQSVPIDLEQNREYLLGVTRSDYDFTLIYTYRDRETKFVKASKFNKKGDLLLTDTIEVLPNELMDGYYALKSSDDERFIVLYQFTRDRSIKMFLYDCREMKVERLNEIEINEINAKRDFRAIEVSNSGDIYIVFERYGYKFKLRDHFLQLLEINRDGSTFESKIPMSNRYKIDVKIVVDNYNNNAKLVGLYGSEYDNVSEGYFVSDLETVKYIPYSNDREDIIINQNVHLMHGLENYRLMDVVLRRDGGTVLVIEKNLEFFRSSPYGRDPLGGYRTGIVDYIAEDILVINAKPNGEIAWKSVLPKRQISQDDNGVYSSYFLFITNSKLHFIFNDEIKTNNTVSEYVLNPLGIYERNAVLSTVNQKLKLRIKSAIQTSADSFVMISERSNRLNIVKVQY